jgi:hypothetical protein
VVDSAGAAGLRADGEWFGGGRGGHDASHYPCFEQPQTATAYRAADAAPSTDCTAIAYARAAWPQRGRVAAYRAVVVAPSTDRSASAHARSARPQQGRRDAKQPAVHKPFLFCDQNGKTSVTSWVCQDSGATVTIVPVSWITLDKVYIGKDNPCLLSSAFVSRATPVVAAAAAAVVADATRGNTEMSRKKARILKPTAAAATSQIDAATAAAAPSQIDAATAAAAASLAATDAADIFAAVFAGAACAAAQAASVYSPCQGE